MNPFARASTPGDRSTALLLSVAIGLSTLVHSGLALAAYIRNITIFPAQPTCRAGETIQLHAYGFTAWNAQLNITNSAQWSVADAKIASHAGAGFFRCVSEGETLVKTAYLNRTTTFALKVEPAIVMVDVPKEEPPPPPPAPEPEPAPPVAQSPVTPPEAKATKDPPPPAAAKVGSLLTADDPSAEKTYDFLSDPNGQEYGSGTAQVGGTSDHGAPGAVASGVPGGSGTGAAQKGPLAAQAPPAVDLSRPPTLTVNDPCKGYFPADADDDIAVVKAQVTIKGDGTVDKVLVLDENPKGQGFGKAARTCLGAAKFNAAFDKYGKPTLATQQFTIRFTR